MPMDADLLFFFFVNVLQVIKHFRPSSESSSILQTPAPRNAVGYNSACDSAQIDLTRITLLLTPSGRDSQLQGVFVSSEKKGKLGGPQPKGSEKTGNRHRERGDRPAVQWDG